MMNISVTPLPNSYRYFLFILLVLLGPTFGVLQLKLFHLSLLFIVVAWFLTRVRLDRIKKSELLYLLLIFISLAFYFLYAFVVVGLDSRSVLYLVYFLISLLVIFVSYKTLIEVDRAKLSRLLVFFIYIDIFFVIVEMVLGISVFALYPLAGSEYQVGSSLWSNANTNIVVLLLANASLFFLGNKKLCFISFVPILVTALMVDAKLCIIAILGQLTFFLFYSNASLRIWFILFFVIISPVVYYAFGIYVGAITKAAVEAWQLLSENELLERLVSSGDLYSVAIRAYALSEMMEMLKSFQWYHWIAGAGFGSINISFFNQQWGGRVDHFSPHFFYIEMFIYGGLLYYMVMLLALKTLSGKVPWKGIILSLPTFGAIVAISSAVYFLPFYFYLAVLMHWDSEESRQLHE